MAHTYLHAYKLTTSIQTFKNTRKDVINDLILPKTYYIHNIEIGDV